MPGSDPGRRTPGEAGFGKSAVLKVHRTGPSKKSVTISAKPYGSAERVVGHVRLDAHGNGQLKVKVTRNSGPWRTIAATGCIELPKSRTVWAKFKASQFLGGAGYPLRMRGEWGGDAKFAGAHSGWTYARFG